MPTVANPRIRANRGRDTEAGFELVPDPREDVRARQKGGLGDQRRSTLKATGTSRDRTPWEYQWPEESTHRLAHVDGASGAKPKAGGRGSWCKRYTTAVG
ncbi:hypothetical protein GCM10010402_38450 [Actinomadura luteofluorescens]